MHDVALEVSRKEICTSSTFTGDIDKTVRHVFAMRDNHANYSMSKAHIRTYFHFGSCETDEAFIAQLLANHRRLRALNLSNFNINHLPASIGKLVHLRHLELSVKGEYLPESITDLFNLQTLNLFKCTKLKELPKKFSKLVNLRDLKLPKWDMLTFMPSGMGTLTGLYKLNRFVVGEGNINLKQHVELEGLKALKNLRGIIKIEIHFPKNGKFANCDGIRDGAYMRDKEHLHGIHFECERGGSNVQTGYEEDLLGALQPHTNLKELFFGMYGGVRLPRWAKDDDLASSLPNLVSLRLDSCSELQEIPSLENLRQLKLLHLSGLPNLEYIENTHATISSGKDSSLLPCLEEIYFIDLPKLKRWWRRSVNGMSDNSVESSNEMRQASSVSLLRLKRLRIIECPEFTCLLYCPDVERLELFEFNGRLQIIGNNGSHDTPSTSYPCTDYSKLREVWSNNLAWLHSSLPLEALQSLRFMMISGDMEEESLTELKQVSSASSSSPKWFGVIGCLSGGLVCLETLYLADEKIDGDGEDDEMPWGSLGQSLQHLRVSDCKELKSFPKWFQKLDSLSHLEVVNCSTSPYERCQEDWPNIRDISLLITTRIRPET